MAAQVGEWYGCVVCGEMRRLVFEATPDGPGCQCRAADVVPKKPKLRDDAAPTDLTRRRELRVLQPR